MGKEQNTIQLTNQIINDVKSRGIAHLHTNDFKLTGNQFHINEQEYINFGSCSYLGLEFDERLIKGAQNAVAAYGTQFSASRAYLSCGYYEDLESQFEQLFGSTAIVAPTTTLGHIATIPVIVQDDDAVIIDHQVHASVQNAVNLLKPRGIRVEMIRHNHMEMLEERVKKLRQKHKKIWYMADGVYSMYGDATPVEAVYELMDKYPELYYYVDDAHGMSCYGKHGRGYVLSKKNQHEKMVFTTSLAKAFATGGAALVFPTAEMAQKVRNCGGPMITSGPMQPAALGAAIASAGIHLSDEIYSLQNQLAENIKYANLLLEKHGLPVIQQSDTPVFFVGVGLPKVGYNLIARMMKEGYFTNIGIFPAVPMKNTGVRFTITRLHTFAQIEQMIDCMAYHYPLALEEENFNIEEVYKAFKIESKEDTFITKAIDRVLKHSELKVQVFDTVKSINKAEWDQLFIGRGCFDYEGLRMLEDSFSNNDEQENNWDFNYLILKDEVGDIIAATFLTCCYMKDDLLAPNSISEKIEKERIHNKYYLTSKVLMMGSPITEGNHLYLNRDHKLWKSAIELILEKINALQEKYNASQVNLRDFEGEDKPLEKTMTENGFCKVSFFDNNIIEKVGWDSEEAYLNSLSSSTKKHVKRYAMNKQFMFNIETKDSFSIIDTEKFYDLYLNVKNKSYELNTFKLPYKFFKKIVNNKNWDIITLKIKAEYSGTGKEELAAMTFSYLSGDTYNFMIVGIDYEFLESHKVYKQALYQITKRGAELGKKAIRFGFTTDTEKKRVGAKQIPTHAFLQAKDHFNMAVIDNHSVYEKSR